MLKKLSKLLIVASAAVFASSPALAQEVPGHGVFILNSLLFLIGGFLVMFMACGFCMLEAGLVRAKNTTMQLTKNVALFSLAAVGYYLIGYNLMYPLGTWSIDGVFSGVFPAVAVMEAVGVSPIRLTILVTRRLVQTFLPANVLCYCFDRVGCAGGTYQAVAFSYLYACLDCSDLPLRASWKWGGGFLDAMGFLDFAGSTVVHSVGGWAALAGVLILGPRIGKYKDGKVVPMPGANLPLATLGTFILWLGWFGFNGGSQLAMGTVGDVADIPDLRKYKRSCSRRRIGRSCPDTGGLR